MEKQRKRMDDGNTPKNVVWMGEHLKKNVGNMKFGWVKTIRKNRQNMETHQQKWLGWMKTLRKNWQNMKTTQTKVACMDENPKEKLAKHGNTPTQVAWMDENPKEKLAKHGKTHKKEPWLDNMEKTRNKRCWMGENRKKKWNCWIMIDLIYLDDLDLEYEYDTDTRWDIPNIGNMRFLEQRNGNW